MPPEWSRKREDEEFGNGGVMLTGPGPDCRHEHGYKGRVVEKAETLPQEKET